MAPRAKAKSIRQSVCLPATLATQIRRVAKQRRIPISRAMVSLAEESVNAHLARERRLVEAYDRLVKETDPQRINAAGDDLMNAIFGSGAFAEDPVH